jgi:3D (Asp-Asp-Asp) domain-containing protein
MKISYIIRTFVVTIVFVVGFIVGSVTTTAGVEQVTEIVTVQEIASVETIEDTPEIISIRCKLTAYCCENYPHICNDGVSTKTATGTSPTVGRTVAVDPSVIPYGSEVIIYGHTYIAEDCGGAIKGNHVDILFATHQEALDFGIQYTEVIIKEKK